MSNLSNLAKTIKNQNKPSNMFDRSPHSKNFTEKFPVIKVDLLSLSSIKVPDQDLTLNENLERQIREYGDKQNKKTNVKAHMTDWFMHDNSTGFQWVCNQAIDIATKNNPHPLDMIAYDCWGAIYKEGDYTVMHNHWPHLWSFVYYVNCPPHSAPLILDKSEKSITILPSAGMMVLFPGWINHSVPAHVGEDRIVIAGNLSMNPFSHIKTLENRGLGQWRSIYGSRGNNNRL